MIKITKNDYMNAKKVVENFKKIKTDKEIFYDLCFCICAPQTTFVSNLKVQNKLQFLDFYTYQISVIDLSHIIKEVRFKNNKARFLLKAKENFKDILKIIKNTNYSEEEKRDIIVKLQPGLGMKTASHFLRNLGFVNFAIIDTHIIKYLKTKIPASLKQYKQIENKFIKKAQRYNMNAAELDAIVWKYYSNTSWENFIF